MTLRSGRLPVALVTTVVVSACGFEPFTVEPGGGFDTDISLYENVDAYVSARVLDDYPAFAITIVKDGATLIEEAYGSLRRDAPDRATVDTPMYLSSLSMQFTAVAVLILVERGDLALTDKASDYVAGLPAEWADMTIHHLLAHQSGLPDYLTDLGLDEPGLTNQMVLDTLGTQGLLFAAGTHVRRSHSGYLLLAEVVEGVSGMSYGAFVQTNVFDPLGMTHSYVVDETSPDIPGRAVGYLTLDSIVDYDHRTTGADGIYSSLSDMHTWMLSFGDHTLLSAATVDSMFVSYEDGGLGYGWYIGLWEGTPAYYEGSVHPAFRTFIGVVRDTDLSYVLLGSGAYGWAPELPSLILAYELGL